MFEKFVIRLILLAFFFTSIGPLPDVSAQSIIDLPAPGMMVNRSNSFEPLQLKGILVNVKNPMRFDFLVDKGDSGLYGQPLKENITRLAKYFLTCLTVPENDLWVNLSPYEKDRIVPGNFGITLMGKDLLEQDYLLKQMMASLSYPENSLGKSFWKKVYRKSYELYGTTNIPINTFNKVWIVPKTADVYVQGNTAFVVNSRLDVMLEADYLSIEKHQVNVKAPPTDGVPPKAVTSQGNNLTTSILREIILPELRQEINKGKNFAIVRQVYNAMILATWYKRHLKDSLLGKMYVGQNKVMGVDVADKNAKEKIFKQYLKAYKKCVYNYIKEDYDPATQQTVPRKYASGGMYFAGFGGPQSVYAEKSGPRGMKIGPDLAMATIDVSATNINGKLISFPDMRAKITNTNPFHQVPQEAREFFKPSQSMDAELNDQAMLVPKFFRPLILTMGLAASSFLMTPIMASAAMPVSSSMHITADTKTQDLVSFLDQQIVSYKKAVRTQEGFLNILDIRGNPDDSNRVLNGLVEEDAFARTLLAAGKSTMDWSDVGSLEISRLRGQIGYLDQQIKQREQKIKDGVSEFKKRERAHDMHAGEVSMLRGNIRYNEGVLKRFIAQRDQLNGQIKADQENQVFSDRVVSSAISSGVNPVATNHVATSLTTIPLPAVETASIASSNTPPVSAGSPPPPPKDTNTIITSSPATTVPTNIPPAQAGVSSPTTNILTQPFFLFSTMMTNPPVSAGPSNVPASNHSILNENTTSTFSQFVVPTWSLYAGIAVLGIGAGGLWFNRRKSIRREVNPNMAASEAQNSTLVIESSSAPLPGTDEERATLPELRAQLKALVSGVEPLGNPPKATVDIDVPPASKVSIWSWSDSFSWVSGMVLALNTFSFDPLSLLTTAFALPPINALYSTSNTWIHEIGHALAAGVLYPLPKYWKKSLSPSNLSGNLTFSQWKEFFIAKLRGAEYQGENPYVSFPAKGWRKWVISKSGLGTTIGVNLFALLATYWATLNHAWLMPVLGVISVKGYSAIKSAWIGDSNGPAEDTDSGECKFNCGVSMHSRFGKRKALAAQGEDASIGRIKDMINAESDRGKHQVGVLAMREGKDGKTVIVLEKAIEGLRGPGSDAVESSTEGLKKSLPSFKADGPAGEEYVMDTKIGHNRLASGGAVVGPAAHPHIGPEQEKVLWSMVNGVLVEGKGSSPDLDVEVARPLPDEDDKENVSAGAAHNGDNDEYKPLDSDRYISDLKELRAFAVSLVRYRGPLAPGDSPVIPLLIQYHLTQGDVGASVNFSHITTHHKNIDEINQDLLADKEEAFAGEIFSRGIRKFTAILSRPGLKDSEKTLRDMYVSRKVAEEKRDDEQVQFQFSALEELRKYLVSEFKKEAAAGHLTDKIAKHWQGSKGEKVISDFVELAIYKFFTGDRDTAVKEFQARSKGTYGLAVKVSTDLNGLTLVSRKLGMFWGVNLVKGYLDASSDPYALLRKYPNGDQLEELSHLDPRGKGEIGSYQVSKVTGKLRVKVFSLERNAYISDDEMYERKIPLKDNRRYYWPLHEYQDKRGRVTEDVEVLTKALAALEGTFDDKNLIKPSSEQDLNYLSTKEVFKSLLGLWINEKINERLFKGGEYKVIFLRLNKAVEALSNECASLGTCSEAHKKFLKMELHSTPENSLLMAVIAHWLEMGSLKLGSMRVDGEINQREVYELIPQFIERRVEHILKLLSVKDLDRIYKYWDYQRKNPPSGKEKIGMLFAGDENSDNGPKNSQDIWDALFPNLPKRFVGSHEILDYQSLPFDITSPKVTLLTSKAAGNYNTMQALEIMLNAVGELHVWGVTSLPISPLSVALGQKLRPESTFNGHVFYTGNHFSSQTQVASESLSSALHILLAISIALDFEKYCPGENPFGLNLTTQKVGYLTRLKEEMMLKDAKRITGYDEERFRVISPVNQALTKRGQYWASRLWEAPARTLVYRLFVWGIFLYGAPVHLALSALGYDPGPGLQSIGGFLTASADFMIALTMPWFLTLIYRWVSKYNPWVLMGPPTNINLVGLNAYPDVQKMLLRVIFSRSYSGWGSQVHASTYQKSIAELGPHITRGSWISGHLGGTATMLRRAKGAFKQLKVTKVGLWGTKFKRTGAISFTTSRGPFQDPDVSDYNIDLGGTEFLPPNDPEMTRVYNVLDAWGATLALKVTASVMADTLTFGSKAWDPSRKVNNALSLTTESAQPPPEKLPLDGDNALLAQDTVSQKGGINMSSRLMQLRVKGDEHRVAIYDNPMTVSAVKGISPQVSRIVPVTSDMLKDMLGEGYLN